jgi:hypothetical protein
MALYHHAKFIKISGRRYKCARNKRTQFFIHSEIYLFPWEQSGWGAKMNTHFHRVPRSRWWSYTSTPPYVFITLLLMASLCVGSFIQRIRPSTRPCKTLRNNMLFHGTELLAPYPTPKAGGPPLVGCLRLLIHYIRSYPPYIEAIYSIRNLRTCNAMVTRDPLNW